MSNKCGVKRGWKRYCFSRTVRKDLDEDDILAQWEEVMCAPRNRAFPIATASWDEVLLGIFRNR